MTNPQIEILEKQQKFQPEFLKSLSLKDIEDIIVLLDGCEVLPQEFDHAAENVRSFLQEWFKENVEELKDAVQYFLPSSSVSRENLVISLIERFAQVN